MMNIKSANVLLGRLVQSLAEATKRVDDDTWETDGKKGKWREALGRHVFYPDDGSDPIGIPKAAQGGGEGGEEDDVGKQTTDLEKLKKDKAGRKKAFGGAKEKLDKAANGIGAKATEDMDDEDEETLDAMDKGKAGDKAVGLLANKTVRRALMLGIGAAIGTAFPMLLGYAAIYMLAKMATGMVKDKMKVATESATSKKEEFARAVEAGIKDSIAKITSGDVDEELFAKAVSFAKRKAVDGKEKGDE
jgi:hypothetical protein